MTSVSENSKKAVRAPKARRFTYEDMRELLYTLLGFVPEGAALKRLYKVANASHADLTAQNEAIHLAVADEATVPANPLQPTLDRMMLFHRSLHHPKRLQPGEPIPWLERNRPAWADRQCDQSVFNIGDTHADAAAMSWRSMYLAVPVSNYYGKWQSDGRFESAAIHLDCRQSVTAREPKIALERHCWNSKGEEVSGVAHHYMTVDEAASLARALLLLVDLATGTSDEIAGA